MKKRFLLIPVLAAVVSFFLSAFAAENSLLNFTERREYDGRFNDVSVNDWFYEPVKEAYELGLMSGESGFSFAPNREFTLSEILAAASSLRALYITGEAEFEPSEPWYQTYTDYARENDFHPAGNVVTYTSPIPRGEVMAILADALPPSLLSPICAIDDGAIPDVKMNDPNAEAIYILYRAGVLSGIDKEGTFNPDKNISRAEMAAIINNIANADGRIVRRLESAETIALDPAEIDRQFSKAVFTLMMYDMEDNPAVSGSGFFLTSDGLAVTNYHVISGYPKAVILTSSGVEYDIEGVYSIDISRDLAIIKVNGEGFKTLPLGDSNSLSPGEAIYAVGSPHGLGITFNAGVVSNALVDVNDETLIQTTAPIVEGNSGGALINSKGQVVGVTCASIEGTDMYFAVPINFLSEMNREEVKPLGINYTNVRYPGCSQAMDFYYFTYVLETTFHINEDGSIVASFNRKHFYSSDLFVHAIKEYRAISVERGMTETKINGGWRLDGESESVSLTVDGSILTITTTVLPKYYSNFENVLDLGFILGEELDSIDYSDDFPIYYYDMSHLFDHDALVSWLKVYYLRAMEANGFIVDKDPLDLQDDGETKATFFYCENADTEVLIGVESYEYTTRAGIMICEK